MKRCCTCNLEKDPTEFNRDRGKHDGRSPRCRECNAANSRAWASANRGRRYELNRRWATANPEKDKASKRKWRETNAGQEKASALRWQRQNPEKMRAKAQRWYRRNHARVLANARINNRLRHVSRTGENAAYVGILLADPCSYCGSRTAGTIDHIEPIVSGGALDWSNLTAACGTCNSRKQDRSLLAVL